MEVTWRWIGPKELNPDEIVITIICQCGNKRMVMRGAGDFTCEDIHVYRYGTKVKNVWCSEANPKNLCIVFEKKSLCKECYRIILCADEKEPFIAVEHVGVAPPEVIRIPFPKILKRPRSMYTDTPYPSTNPYEKNRNTR